MGLFNAQFEGRVQLESVPEDFSERMARRVASGLLAAGNRARANYAVRLVESDTVSFGAEDALTAFNIGLNEVALRRLDKNTV